MIRFAQTITTSTKFKDAPKSPLDSIRNQRMTNMRKAISILAFLSSSFAAAEPTALLEACNNIPNSAKRLECFEELFKSRPQAQSSNSASKLREAIIGLDSAIASQLSLSQFKALRLELAKQLGIYKASTNANSHVVDLASEALNAYTDAETFWSANIREGGSRGLLSPEDMASLGMGSFIEKYKIPLTDLNWNKWVSRANGLNAILLYAKSKADLAASELQ